MPVKSVAGKAALNIAVSVSLLIVGIGGGAALGLIKGPASASASVPRPLPVTTSTRQTTSLPPDSRYLSPAGVNPQEDGPPGGHPGCSEDRRPTSSAGASLSIAVPGTADVPVPKGNCGAALDDRKINWLLNLVAKAKDANPDEAAVADRVAGQLRSALGKNMCAEEAQVHIEGMCADRGTKEFMALMVKELPFFVRPLVGDPCKHDLVAAANKWLPSS